MNFELKGRKEKTLYEVTNTESSDSENKVKCLIIDREGNEIYTDYLTESQILEYRNGGLEVTPL